MFSSTPQPAAQSSLSQPQQLHSTHQQQQQQQQQLIPQPPQQQPSPHQEPQLPRGECSFILPDHDAQTGSRQRCSCRSFFPDHVVRSRCGCGHQAWHHEAQPLSSVSMDEHIALVEEVKRLKMEMKKLQKVRVDMHSTRTTWEKLHQRQYMAMRDLKLHMDDKVEAVVDKSQEISDSLKTLGAKLISVEDTNFDLENRLERLELGRGIMSRSLTPVVETSLESTIEKSMVIDSPVHHNTLPMITHLPIRIDKKVPLTWNVRVVFVPNRTQTYAFDYDSVGMKRCKSRNLVQDITFTASDSNTFATLIESHFRQVLRGRTWVPLIGYRPEDEPYGPIVLRQLPVHEAIKEKYDHTFLDRQCIVHDKMQGDLLHISLEQESLSWADIRFLPTAPGADPTCWEHDEELDGKQPGFGSLDSALMYDFQEPPPYSSRTHSEMENRLSSPLEMLAHASSIVPFADGTPRTGSIRSGYSDVRSLSDKSISEVSFSGRSAVSTADMSDDEHRDKKLRMKMSLPSLNHAGSTAPSMYVSSRSKRKLPSTGKKKEAVHWNVNSLATPLASLRRSRAGPSEQVESP